MHFSKPFAFFLFAMPLAFAIAIPKHKTSHGNSIYAEAEVVKRHHSKDGEIYEIGHVDLVDVAKRGHNATTSSRDAYDWPSVSVSKRGHGAGSTTNGKVGLKAVERRGHGSASQSLDSRDVEKRGHGSATKSVDNSLFEKRGHGAATNGEAYDWPSIAVTKRGHDKSDAKSDED